MTTKFVPGDLLYNKRVDCYYLILAINEDSWLGTRYYFLDMSTGKKDYDLTYSVDSSKNINKAG